MHQEEGIETYVVDMFSANRGCYTLALCSTLNPSLVLKLSLLLNKVPLGGVMIAMVKLAMLDSTELSLVTFGQHLAVLNWLYGAVIMVLVNLLVDSSVNLFMLMRLDSLMCHSGSNGLVDGGVMMTRLRSEVGECCFDLVHFDAFN